MKNKTIKLIFVIFFITIFVLSSCKDESVKSSDADARSVMDVYNVDYNTSCLFNISSITYKEYFDSTIMQSVLWSQNTVDAYITDGDSLYPKFYAPKYFKCNGNDMKIMDGGIPGQYWYGYTGDKRLNYINVEMDYFGENFQFATKCFSDLYIADDTKFCERYDINIKDGLVINYYGSEGGIMNVSLSCGSVYGARKENIPDNGTIVFAPEELTDLYQGLEGYSLCITRRKVIKKNIGDEGKNIIIRISDKYFEGVIINVKQ